MKQKSLLAAAALALASLVGIRALASVVSTEPVLHADEPDAEDTIADPPVEITGSF